MNTWLQTVPQEPNPCIQTANCGIVQPQFIEVYATEGEAHILNIGTHFIHMPNTVAEHKMTNITNNR